jgi:hypothetical protein
MGRAADLGSPRVGHHIAAGLSKAVGRTSKGLVSAGPCGSAGPGDWHQRGARLNIRAMIRIATTPAAFEAIAPTIPFGDVGFERDVNAPGSG